MDDGWVVGRHLNNSDIFKPTATGLLGHTQAQILINSLQVQVTLLPLLTNEPAGEPANDPESRTGRKRV